MPDSPPLDLRETEEGIVIKVSVQPKASRQELSGIREGVLRLRLTAPPVEGAANEACRIFLAELFQISKSRILIIRGHQSRQKSVQIQGMTSETVRQHLRRLAIL